MLRIAIIIGSTRPGRKAEAVAKWVYQIAQMRSDAEFELVDIRDFNLSLLDTGSSLSRQSLQNVYAGIRQNLFLFEAGRGRKNEYVD
jgi:NAD(P)H-dependent FMN reductase